MAVSIPSTAYQQVRRSISLDANSQRGYRVQFKGTDFDALLSAANAMVRGDKYDGWILDSWSLEDVPGGGGMLTLGLVPDDGTLPGSPPTKAQKAVWTCKSVRNDVSIYAYCGSGANRTELELWQKETDADLAAVYSFHKNKTTTGGLDSQTQKIAEKIEKGVESVIRFYPVISCTSYWSRVPKKFMENLGYINSPADPDADVIEKPSNLSSIINAHSWLKVQDDVAETGDGRCTRTESWMGIPNTDGNGWDEDLYGKKRWPMPITGGSDSGGNN